MIILMLMIILIICYLEKNRDTWFFAFITDINEEERQKGKTVEVGRASFSLEQTRFTILVKKKNQLMINRRSNCCMNK